MFENLVRKPICPRCNNQMLVDKSGLIEIWECPNCKGIIFPLFSRTDTEIMA